MSDIMHDLPWTNGPDEPEECETHPGQPKPCWLCRMDEDERRADEKNEGTR